MQEKRQIWFKQFCGTDNNRPCIKRNLLWKPFSRKIINEVLCAKLLTVLLESEKHVNVFIFQTPNLQRLFCNPIKK